MDPGCLGGAQQRDKRQGAETNAQGATPEYEDELNCAGDRALEQTVQRGSGLSLTGKIQGPSERNPVPRALG